MTKGNKRYVVTTRRASFCERVHLWISGVLTALGTIPPFPPKIFWECREVAEGTPEYESASYESTIYQSEQWRAPKEGDE